MQEAYYSPIPAEDDPNRSLLRPLSSDPQAAEFRKKGSFARPISVSVSEVIHNIIPSNSPGLTTFLLINTMIGSGILNQPFVFMTSGVIGASVSYVIAAYATWVGLMLLTEVGNHVKVYEYSGLAYKIYGKNGERIVDISIILFAFGALLGYIVVVGDTLSNLFQSWGCDSEYCGNFWVTLLTVTFLVTPFCLIRHFGHFAWLSVFSIATIVSVLLLVLIGGPMKQEKGEVRIFDVAGTLQCMGSIVFSLACAPANFQAYVSTETEFQTPKAWRGITGGAVGIGSIMCAAMGIGGYLAFRGETEGEILENFEQHAFDFFKLMVVIHLILYIPVNFVILRYSIVKISMNMKSEDLEWYTHTMLTLGLLAVTTCIVLLLDVMGLSSGTAFGIILNITGGIAGSLSTFIIPSILFLKVMPREHSLYSPAVFEMCFGFFVLIAVVTETALSLQ